MTFSSKSKNPSLFEIDKSSVPLPERVRPAKISEIIGQDHLLGKDGLLNKVISSGNLHSMMFWGPPGSGKTTLARLLANQFDAEFVQINAVSSGVKEIRDIINEADKYRDIGKQTILFIDEIHRFNKSQQAALLSSVEKGIIILIGATTENPSFEVISPLLSRCQVYVLNALNDQNLIKILDNAIKKDEQLQEIDIDNDAKDELVRFCGGDARVMLNALEISGKIAVTTDLKNINKHTVKEAHQTQHYKYDQKGEEHYNTISAFIKSVRGSDPDAAVYYLSRMLEDGKDPKFIARRVIIIASEDIGNAEPYALTLATACFTAVNYIGMPEASLVLAQTSTYLASCPKSNSSTIAISNAMSEVRNRPYLNIPLHLRNAPTDLMKDLGYGKDYKYSHNYEDHISDQQYLPNELEGKIFYEPTEIGREASLKKYLEVVRKKKRNKKKVQY